MFLVIHYCASLRVLVQISRALALFSVDSFTCLWIHEYSTHKVHVKFYVANYWSSLHSPKIKIVFLKFLTIK